MKYDLVVSRHINAGSTIKILATSNLGVTRSLWEWHGGPDDHDPIPKDIPAHAVNFLMNMILEHVPSPTDHRLQGGSYVTGPDGLKRWISGPITE